MKNMLVVLLGVTVGSLPFASHAGSGVDAVTVGVLNTPPVAAAAATNAPTDEDTNAIPMKVQMASGSLATNTIGTVLIKVSPNLWVGKYEVTQKEYEKLAHSNPSAFHGETRPVDSVTWNDAMGFCTKLTAKEQAELPDGFGYSLPTEKQWEMLVGNASVKDAVMKYNQDCSSTAPVGSLGANNLGLFDIRGNVMEWCLDAHDPSYHILRGGAWDISIEPSTRVEFRNYVQNPAEKKNDYGFRVVLEAVGK